LRYNATIYKRVSGRLYLRYHIFEEQSVIQSSDIFMSCKMIW